RQDSANSGYGHSFTFTYDGVNRLWTAVATGSPAYNLTYNYDQYGNGWCVGGSGGGVCPALNYNSSKNQLTSIGGGAPVTVNYDAAGNQLNDQYSVYQYDAEGRVTHSSSSGQWQYPTYNALGQRVEDYQSAGSSDSMKLSYPRDIFGNRTGIWDDHSSVNWVGWDIYWSQVAGQRLNMGGASAYIGHSDAIGSTTMETDPAGGVQWDMTHYPWGQIWQQGGTRQSGVFADLDWQVNDPLHPSATREYNDGLFRWNTPDPDNAGADVGDSQSWDMYSYAGDNPSSRNDPSGMLYCSEPDESGTSNCVLDEEYFNSQDQFKGYTHFESNYPQEHPDEARIQAFASDINSLHPADFIYSFMERAVEAGVSGGAGGAVVG
ncbi:MAG: RHS repeat-associated core domain-containing protein, partial [Limisphaerales bacterium]